MTIKDDILELPTVVDLKVKPSSNHGDVATEYTVYTREPVTNRLYWQTFTFSNKIMAGNALRFAIIKSYLKNWWKDTERMMDDE